MAARRLFASSPREHKGSSVIFTSTESRAATAKLGSNCTLRRTDGFSGDQETTREQGTAHRDPNPSDRVFGFVLRFSSTTDMRLRCSASSSTSSCCDNAGFRLLEFAPRQCRLPASSFVSPV